MDAIDGCGVSSIDLINKGTTSAVRNLAGFTIWIGDTARRSISARDGLIAESILVGEQRNESE